MARIKGVAMMNAVKALRAQKERARELLPARMHGYLDERITVSRWYPEEDQLELLRVLASLLPDVVPEGAGDIYEYMGRFTALRDMQGLYSHLLRPGDPEGTLRLGAATWKAYHDTGDFRVSFAEPGTAVLELSGYGLPSSEMCRLLRGWYTQLIEMTGAKDVDLTKTHCRNQGDNHCAWLAEWKA